MKTKIFIMIVFAALMFGLSASHKLGMASQTKFTGCLQSGTESNSYTLSNADGTYDLMPVGGVNLKKEVGHKVEVTGTMTKQGVVSSLGNVQSPISRGKGLQNPFKDVRPGSNSEITVSSIRHISNSCR